MEKFEPDPVIEAYKARIDRTLIRQSLRMTHEERLGALQDWLDATDEARGSAGRRVAGGGAAGRGP